MEFSNFDISIEQPISGYNTKPIIDTPFNFLLGVNDLGQKRFLIQSLEGFEVTAVDNYRISIGPIEHEGSLYILGELRSNDAESIFDSLIDDLYSVAQPADSHDGALKNIKTSLNLWIRCFQGNNLRLLSDEAQRGLIGELLFLEKLLSKFSESDAITFWHGPLGKPQDFYLTDKTVEVKTKLLSGSNQSKIFISSAEQLDQYDDVPAYLYLYGLRIIPNDDPQALSLFSLIQRISNRLKDDESLNSFQNRLVEMGYSPEHRLNYRYPHFCVSSEQAYEIKEDFPKIIPPDLKPGVCEVKYKISLDSLEQFKITNIL